ncbi:TetR-like C-terminal domain-containing protein [Nocardioides sp. NPDC051685]|uniref:TetR-like C-terminal domain-containing protein n=1 Tax=Nocardioides sp. NPDC051685 TaxID=3364334 RepID=UPI0037A55F7F
MSRQRRPGGRSARVRAAVVEAVMEAVRSGGIDAVTVAAVAAAADVNESSIYRRWGSRDNLVLDALLGEMDEHLPVPDTGSLRDDLLAYATSLAEYLSGPLGHAVDKALILAADNTAAGSARARFWESRLALVEVMVRHAEERGELQGSADASFVLQLLVAPLHFRAILTHEPIDDDYLARLVDVVVRGIGTRATSTA